MLKLLGTVAAAALLLSSAASFADSAERSSVAGTARPDSAARAQAPHDFWADSGLTAADMGEAALPWTTFPRLEDEIPSGSATKADSNPRARRDR